MGAAMTTKKLELSEIDRSYLRRDPVTGRILPKA